jgi:hypothetical protein
MLKRSVVAITCAMVLALVAAPVAGAQDPDLQSYGAGASATALFLDLLDQELTFSSTGAAVRSTPKANGPGSKTTASAAGVAATTPIFSSDPSTMVSDGAPASGQSCVLDLNLPEPINVTGGGISCVDTKAEVTGSSPTGTAASDEVRLDIISAALVGQLTDDLLRPLLTQLLAGIETVLTSIDDLVPADLSLDTLIDLLLDDLADGGPLARVGVGQTTSTASDVEARSTVEGVTIEVLPNLLPGGSLPLATITVGDSFANAAYDAATGKVVTDGEAAFLDVDLIGLEVVLDAIAGTIVDTLLAQLPDPLGDTLGPLVAMLTTTVSSLDEPDGPIESVVNVTIHQLACPASPLATVLCFEAGTVNELDAAGLEGYGFAFGDGTKGIEASILGLNVLDSTLVLGVGQTAAAANAVTDTPLPSAPSQPDRSLPRTGGSPSGPLALVLLAAATVGIALVRRTCAA